MFPFFFLFPVSAGLFLGLEAGLAAAWDISGGVYWRQIHWADSQARYGPSAAWLDHRHFSSEQIHQTVLVGAQEYSCLTGPKKWPPEAGVLGCFSPVAVVCSCLPGSRAGLLRASLVRSTHWFSWPIICFPDVWGWSYNPGPRAEALSSRALCWLSGIMKEPQR